MTEYDIDLDSETAKLLDEVIGPLTETQGDDMISSRARKENAESTAHGKGHKVVWLGSNGFTKAELAICSTCEATGSVYPEPRIPEGADVGKYEHGDLFEGDCIGDSP